jgi:hypothetical protein
MQEAEIKWNVFDEGTPTQGNSLAVFKTLDHLVEVINEMQEEIKKLQDTNNK